ncbi:[Fe-Fe] hydrogenase large subunit C-terminal domain-containing protein [Clostridium oceanicum]|uniref:[Fe-Fe] hydrogenase large subunit C-terminal domain-containing protein n=1 Tax=Clostridium oceanicum TaxID=1543 RepID=A0ABN1JN76_9CLOT
MDYIKFTKANCKNCYKCLRSCPVKAIQFKNEQAKIINDRCILCSRCVLICPQNARKVNTHINKLKNALKNNKKIIVSLAPSFAGNFNFSYKKLIGALKTLGISYVEETALGADITSRLYEKFINNNKMPYYISTACPSSNMLIEKYYPELIKYMLPILSPMACHCKTLKEVYGKDAFVIFIGPCSAKKTEYELHNKDNILDAVITYEECIKLLDDFNINIESSPDIDFDCNSFNSGPHYPIPGGICNNIKDSLKFNNIKPIAVDGVYDCIDVFENIKKGYMKNSFIEVSICKGSCIGGPDMIQNKHIYYNKLEKVENYIKNRTLISNEKLNKKEKDLSIKNFSKNFIDKSLEDIIFSEKEMEDTLKSMGKYSEEDELNCGVCGYNTCREKAKAILKGMAEPTMCLHYMRNKAESISNIIFENTASCVILLDKNLNILEINPAVETAFCVEKNAIKNKHISILMDETDFEYVKNTNKNLLGKKVHCNNYNLVFIENIIYIPKQNIFMASMINITELEKNKQNMKELKKTSFTAAQEVIEKQMRVAQEIASLLGETTAETKITLSNLKKFVNTDDEN